ncbi:MAG TPA: T9SS type A sorting domain-containing protein [Chitinophagales bacterium]|nr:T9SS type A sorting domain-containing protein [Chitinophagales bacterium]HRK26528.1 T9SS type A sorting domain-containing protein [Chitinophagales bacterium]
MIKKVLLLSLFLFFSMAAWNRQYVHTNSTQPPLGRTGAPTELTCAGAGCHAGAPNTGSGSVNIIFSGDGTGSQYTPGNTYVIGVTLTGGIRYGFEMVALNSSNQSVGTFIGNAPNLTGTGSQNNRQYIFHRNIPNPYTGNFTFQWTAPATAEGPITFYAAGNAANGDLTGNGDFIYTKTLTINPVAVGIDDPSTLPNSALAVYPNPITDNALHVQYNLATAQNVMVSVFNLHGQLQEVLYNGTQNAGTVNQNLSINKANYPQGLYLLQVQTQNGEVQTQKVLIQ